MMVCASGGAGCARGWGAAAGLLLRSLAAARNTSPGFDARGVLAFSLQLPSKAYRGREAVDGFYTRLMAELRAIPGVVDAKAVRCPPGAGDCGDWFYSIPGRPAPPENDVPIALFNSAEAGYFRMMRIPIRQGREFDQTDRPGNLEAAIVNETFARRWWPGESAVGRQIKVGGPYREGELLPIVGVAGDVRQFGLDAKPMPEIWLASAQQHSSGMTILTRAAGNPAGLMGAVRRKVLALDPGLPLQRFGPLGSRWARDWRGAVSARCC
jgi:putative ABC transport system permease protein